MKLIDQIEHKLRHLRLITNPSSFCEMQTCVECGGESYKVYTPTEISVTCECGSLKYERVQPCK